MKRLKILILVFCLAVSCPLAFVVWQTYQRLNQEEHAQLRFFSEALFDELEKEMSALVQLEENRAVDEYNFNLAKGKDGIQRSPLARPPKENYILGYLQNNPDGSFQSPLIKDMGRVAPEQRKLVSQLRETNTIFNGKKFSLPSKPAPPVAKPAEKPKAVPKKKGKTLFADRYLSKQQAPAPKSYLGRKSVRKEEISARQALNIAKEDSSILRSRTAPAATADVAAEQESVPVALEEKIDADNAGVSPSERGDEADAKFQVEVAPLQSVYISLGRFFIFRRIAINNQIYRQGFVLEVEPFLRHLAATHFNAQPMAQFTGLRLQAMENGTRQDTVRAGIHTDASEVITQRTFPAPFDFLSAVLTAAAAPPSPARSTLNIAVWILGIVMLLGLVAIYQSTRAVVDLSERRSQFVSSVTHELKTPLTNIRMYIEMLEQGIAATPEREQDYLQILGSESTRLSRLINNVLELAKLEKKQRHFDLREGQLEDVLTEVQSVMAPKLEQEGFGLTIKCGEVPTFVYDREVLIQVLINLIENCVKFGRTAPEKAITISTGTTDRWACISVCDTGPGIPRRALKKVFDDFYRVDNKLTRTTGGTGIGLALVKKFIVAMGGRVQATNNEKAGCTIALMLPLSGIKHQASK
ncbi:MAG: HAMP domain-containing sensor histidine kinase [Desulfobacteraceae bacterium]|jgi:signal transduction histidine kinase